MMADWLSVQGQARAALAIYQRLLATESAREMLAHAHLGAGLTLLNGLSRPTDAYQHLIRAQQLSSEERVTRAAGAGLAQIRALQKMKFRGN